MRMKRLLVVGRFQPPHLGHLHTIKWALGRAEEVIVVVGSAQESYTLENPMTAGERVHALRLMLEELDDWCRRLMIAPVPDIAMNKVWVQYLKMLLPPFDGVVSGNELVLMLFEDMGLAALRPPMFRRGECSGTRIRRLMASGESGWEDCLHPQVRRYVEEIGLPERLRRLQEMR